MGIFNIASFIFMISKMSTSASTFVVQSCFGACTFQAFFCSVFFWFGGVSCFQRCLSLSPECKLTLGMCVRTDLGKLGLILLINLLAGEGMKSLLCCEYRPQLFHCWLHTPWLSAVIYQYLTVGVLFPSHYFYSVLHTHLQEATSQISHKIKFSVFSAV